MLTTNFEESQDISNFELIKEDEALLGFIADYLSKRGFNDTVKELYNEKNTIKLIPREKVSNLIESVNQVRGNLPKEESVLFEWWKVFWNILKENKQKTKNEVKRSFTEASKDMKIIIEEVNQVKTEHPYKKLKKKPVKPPVESMNTLDISSLTGIEKSLISTNLMNKDLTKLTAEEGKRIDTALRNNKVAKESWEIYLKLCKEYQKMPQVLKNPKINYGSPNPDFINGNNSNYLGVIDQVNQPIDSRQLLLLRQSLYQEYLKKQQSNSYPIYNLQSKTLGSAKSVTPVVNNTNVNTIINTDVTRVNTKNTVNTSTAVVNTPSNTTSVNNRAVNDSNATASIFEPFEIKEELNFNDFMNEYLI